MDLRDCPVVIFIRPWHPFPTTSYSPMNLTTHVDDTRASTMSASLSSSSVHLQLPARVLPAGRPSHVDWAHLASDLWIQVAQWAHSVRDLAHLRLTCSSIHRALPDDGKTRFVWILARSKRTHSSYNPNARHGHLARSESHNHVNNDERTTSCTDPGSQDSRLESWYVTWADARQVDLQSRATLTSPHRQEELLILFLAAQENRDFTAVAIQRLRVYQLNHSLHSIMPSRRPPDHCRRIWADSHDSAVRMHRVKALVRSWNLVWS